MPTSKPQITRVAAYGILTQRSDLLLCRLSAQVGKYQGWWTLPGGGVELGEHPEQAMVREVEEETGLIVEPAGLLGVHSFTIQGSNDDFQSIQIVYRAKVLGGDLRHELEGTTDLCAWHKTKNIRALDTVEVVEKALEFVANTSA